MGVMVVGTLVTLMLATPLTAFSIRPVFKSRLSLDEGSTTRRLPLFLAPAASHGNKNNPLDVDRVSICMAELCQCHEEENANTIQTELLSRDLPYTVEDSPCLGACGVGPMVSIEYENGDYALVMGLEETLAAVGIEMERTTTVNAQEEREGDMGITSRDPQNLNTVETLDKDATEDAVGILSQEESTIKELEETRTILETSDVMEESLQKEEIISNAEDHGAVDRMRNEAQKAEQDNANPWVNMAAYLAKKAKESVLG